MMAWVASSIRLRSSTPPTQPGVRFHALTTADTHHRRVLNHALSRARTRTRDSPVPLSGGQAVFRSWHGARESSWTLSTFRSRRQKSRNQQQARRIRRQLSRKGARQNFTGRSSALSSCLDCSSFRMRDGHVPTCPAEDLNAGSNILCVATDGPAFDNPAGSLPGVVNSGSRRCEAHAASALSREVGSAKGKNYRVRDN